MKLSGGLRHPVCTIDSFPVFQLPLLPIFDSGMGKVQSILSYGLGYMLLINLTAD